jgi:hypothetical protein
MRARKSPIFAGSIRLDTDEGWAQIMAAVEQTLDLIGMAARISELTTTKQQEYAKKFLIQDAMPPKG